VRLLHVALVVQPGDAEHDDPLGLDDPLDDGCFLELGPGLDDGLEGLEDFLDGLEELGLVGVALFEAVEDGLHVLVCYCHVFTFDRTNVQSTLGKIAHRLYIVIGRMAFFVH